MDGTSPRQSDLIPSQALFEKLFEFSPDAIVVTDSQGRITSLNAQVERMFGFSREELLGQPVEILIPERFRKGHPQHRESYCNQATLRPMGAGLELFGRRKDGSEFPVDIMLSPVETTEGKVILSVIRDISDKKRDQEALRRSEQELRSLFEFSPDAIVVTDADGRITNANAQVQRAFGYTREELLGKPVETLIPQRLRNAHPNHRQIYNATPSVRPMGAGLELYGLRKDGTEFPVDIMLSPVETAVGRVTVGVIRDISDRKHIEEILRQTEERFRLLVENARDYAIFMMDTSGQIVSWNPGAERLKGYRADEIIGRSFSCFYTVEDIRRGTPDDALHLAAARGRYESEGWRVRKDGSRFWANAVITSIRDKKGNLLGFAKVTRDFTERKKAEEALQHNEQQLRALFEFSPDAIIASDQEGQIIQVNARVETAFGYNRAELLGQSIDILVPERFRQTHPTHRREYSDRARGPPDGHRPGTLWQAQRWQRVSC